MSYELDFISEDCYEGTTVLKNKLNIKDEAELLENEALITTYKTAVIENTAMKPDFNFEDYLALHKFMFEDLYE